MTTQQTKLSVQKAMRAHRALNQYLALQLREMVNSKISEQLATFDFPNGGCFGIRKPIKIKVLVQIGRMTLVERKAAKSSGRFV